MTHMEPQLQGLPVSRVWNLPNILTYGRIVAVPAVAGLLLWTERAQGITGLDVSTARWLALGIYIIAAITDFFDGYLARKWGQQSALGKMLDPIADKVLVAVVLLVLCGDQILRGGHVWAAIIILAREVLVSGLREFLGQLRVSVPVTQIAKWKTTVQLVAIGFLIAGPAGDTIIPGVTWVGIVGLWIAAALTLYTGYDYFRAGIRHVVDEK
jgi:cardiolipin synthase (CMP-forming)